jgi:hypothetical protein
LWDARARRCAVVDGRIRIGRDEVRRYGVNRDGDHFGTPAAIKLAGAVAMGSAGLRCVPNAGADADAVAGSTNFAWATKGEKFQTKRILPVQNGISDKKSESKIKNHVSKQNRRKFPRVEDEETISRVLDPICLEMLFAKDFPIRLMPALLRKVLPASLVADRSHFGRSFSRP